MGGFKSGLNFLDKYLACFESKSPAFYCGIQDLLFKVIVPLDKGSGSSGITQKKSSTRAILHLLLACVSITSLIRAKLKGIKICHYMIDTRSGKNGLDHRSGYILNIVPSSKTINFLHINSGKKALKGVFKHHYPIYFESIIWWAEKFSPKNPSCLLQPNWLNKLSAKETSLACQVFEHHKARYQQALIALNVLGKIVSFIKPTRFIFIDDGRHANELVLSCNQLKIPTLGYMHNRFNEFHIGLKYFPFDTYLVWSPYYQNKIKEMLRNSSKQKIINIGHPAYKTTTFPKVSNGKINVLWLGESNISEAELSPIINELLQSDDIQLFYRPKPGEQLTSLKGISKLNAIIRDNSANLFEALSKNNINVIIGTHSTALIDSWLIEVPSVMIDSSYDYGSHLIEDHLVYGLADKTSIISTVKEAARISTQEKTERKLEIWGDSSTLKHEVIQHELC